MPTAAPYRARGRRADRSCPSPSTGWRRVRAKHRPVCYVECLRCSTPDKASRASLPCRRNRTMPGRRQLLIPALALTLVSHAAAEPPAPSTEPILGFSTEGATAQRALETRFDASLNASNLRTWMQRITSHPHHVGSPWDKSNAEYMADLFRSWGYQTQIEQFKVLFPTPKVRLLEMEAPTHFKASLAEPPVPGDTTSGQTAEQLP